eukprot:1139440-Pelagomonas_calceolata.AAC.1
MTSRPKNDAPAGTVFTAYTVFLPFTCTWGAHNCSNVHADMNYPHKGLLKAAGPLDASASICVGSLFAMRHLVPSLARRGIIKSSA